MKWEIRYSSSEMMYVEVIETQVLCYLNGDKERATRFSFAQIVNGAADNEVGSLFGSAVLMQLKTIAQSRIGGQVEP